MKLIIAGSRNIPNFGARELATLIEKLQLVPTEVVSGGARGIDQLGEQWARTEGIPVRQFIPDWNGYAGMRAGFVRNSQMALYARGGALLAIWDGASRGTFHMIHQAELNRLTVHVHRIKPAAETPT